MILIALLSTAHYSYDEAQCGVVAGATFNTIYLIFLTIEGLVQCSQRARPLVGRPIGHRPGQGGPLRKQPRPI